MPSYDTGAWSKYDQYSESNLNYHELLTEFLQELCQRTHSASRCASTTPATPPAPATAAGSRDTAGRHPHGTRDAGGATASAAQASTAIPGDAIYCTTAQRFTADLHTPPVIALSDADAARGRACAACSCRSRRSHRQPDGSPGRARGVDQQRATWNAAGPRLLWVTPRTAGTYAVSSPRRDLAGNIATASSTITLGAPVRHRKH